MLDQRPLEGQRDARTVARLAVRREGAAMTQRREAGQCERQDTVTRRAARIGDEADAARVVLERRVVERWLLATRRSDALWGPVDGTGQ